MYDFTKERKYLAQKKEFDAYYEQKLLPILQKNEATRHKYYLRFIFLLLSALVFYPLLMYFIVKLPQFDAGWILAISALFISLVSGPVYAFKKFGKNNIMEEFAGFFGTFHYGFGYGLPRDILIASGLFKPFNSKKSDDLFSGIYEDTLISVSEEKLAKNTRTTETLFSDIINLDDRVIFRGICVLAVMNKKFTGRTLVLKDKGLFNAFSSVKGLERVKLEDSFFESVFEVYSDDQVEARYLLTTAFMERMLKLRDLFGGKNVQFSFYDKQLLIALPTKVNMFETVSFFSSNIDKKRIDNVFNQFYTIFSIVDILKLNQRI
jgi:hypothetical protein